MRVVFLLCVCICGCSPRWEDRYVVEYQYLKALREPTPSWTASDDYFLVVLVDARHLNYRSPEACFLSMRYGLLLPQEPTIGHAWILLGSPDRMIECGHSGERGVSAPRYFDEVYARSLRGEENPAAYLFTDLPDGYLQYGSGGHIPTVAVAFSLTRAGYERVLSLIADYDFSEWGIQRHHCVHFVQACLSAIGISTSCSRCIQLPRDFIWNGLRVHLWSDEAFSLITCSPPEELEKQLLICLQKNVAQDARAWYRQYKCG